MILPRLTVLEDQYAIGRVLDDDRPFEVTYQAWDLMTEDQVVLKEYFPRTLARREEGSTHLVWDEAEADLYQYGLEQFIKEAEALDALDQENLVREVERFEANGTAYRALEHHAGALLASVLKQQGGKLAPKTALGIVMPILDGLKAAHQQDLVHAGITPEAIFLAKSGRPLLIDFRMAQAMLARRMKKPYLLATDGFAAPEQYLSEGPQGPWTDVYGVAATLYHVMTGRTLPPAYERLETDPVPGLLEQIGGVPSALREMLYDALAMEPSERTRTASALQEQLLSLAKRKEIKEGRPATTIKDGDSAAASAISKASQLDEIDEAETEPSEVAAPDDAEQVSTRATATPSAEPSEAEASDAEEAMQEAFADADPEADAVDAASTEVPASVDEEEVADDVEAMEMDETILMTPPPAFTGADEAEAGDAPTEETFADADRETKPAEGEATEAAQADEAEAETTEGDAVATPAPSEEDEEPAAPPVVASDTEPTPPPAPDRSARRRVRPSRHKEKSRKSIPVLAAVLAVVVIASLGGYLVMNPGGETDRFAYYKAKGDSLFEQAEYVAAKTEYEQALNFQADENVAARVTELEERIAQQQQDAYLEQIEAGDARYQRGDSLLQTGESAEALRFFAEANRAYVRAAQLNPRGDSLASAKAQQASEAMNTASSEASGSSSQIDQDELNQQLYTSYRQQGDALLRQGDLQAAQRKFEEALEYRRGDRYARNRLEEIALRMSEAEAEEDFQRLMARAAELCDQGQCAEAVDEYQSALEIKPGNQTAQQGLNRAQEAQRTAEAQSQRYQYFRGQGDTYLAQGNLDAAIASYESALEQRPDDPYAQQKIEEARRALEAQQQQQPEEAEQQPENVTDEGVYLVAEQPPRLIGGLGALHRKVRYPEEAYEKGIEGRVYVQFVVDKNGDVQDAEVMRGLGSGCDEEALRVIQQARFEPGTIGGEPVKVRHTLYIQYKR